MDLTELCSHGGCTWRAQMVAGMRSLSKQLNNSLKSERSRLSGSVIELLTVVSTGLGPAFDPLVSLFMPSLLGLCARTNKVSASWAKACITAIINHTKSPSILPHLAESVHHASGPLRLVAAEGVLACMNCFILPDNTTHLIESVIKSASRDACEDVRTAGKKILEAYKALSPQRAGKLISTITAPIPAVRTKQSEVRGTANQVPSRSHPTTVKVPSSKLDTSRQGNITRTVALTTQRPQPDLEMSVQPNALPTTRSGPRRPFVREEHPAKRTVTSRGKIFTPPLSSQAVGKAKPTSGGQQTTKSTEPVVKAPSRCSKPSETKDLHTPKPATKDIFLPNPTAIACATTMPQSEPVATHELPAPVITHDPLVPREEKTSSRAAHRLQTGAWRPCRRQSRVRIPLASVLSSTPRRSISSTLSTLKACGIIAHT